MSRALLSCLLLSGCYRPLPHHINSDFEKQVLVFEEITGRPVNITIDYGPEGATVIATCYKQNGVNWIGVNYDLWQSMGDAGREQTMLHELGHCILYLKHDSTKIDLDGHNVPKSIMYPSVFGDNGVYITHKMYYYDEYVKH